MLPFGFFFQVFHCRINSTPSPLEKRSLVNFLMLFAFYLSLINFDIELRHIEIPQDENMIALLTFVFSVCMTFLKRLSLQSSVHQNTIQLIK
jgi:hypothetical protein